MAYRSNDSVAANYNEDCRNTLMNTDITVESNDSGTGKIGIYWRSQ